MLPVMSVGSCLRSAAAVALLASVACAAEATDDDHDSGAEHSHDSSGATTDDPTSATGSGSTCVDETRDDDYMLGLEHSGERVTVRFVDAQPAPPARFDNLWILEVVDTATGMPLDDVTLDVEPYMPDHQHGTSIACHVTEMDTPGQLELDPVNLFMPGLWEVRLNFTLADATTDQVVFRFCVDP